MAYKRISPVPVIEGGTQLITWGTAYGLLCAGTTVTNPSQWWTGVMNFSGYNGTGNLSGSSPGLFLLGHRYKIKYGIWCECKSWMQSTVLLEFNRSMRKPKVTEFQEPQLESHRSSTE